MNIKESIQFEKNLYNLINTCGLPVSTAFYILKSVYLDFENTLYKCAENEPETFSTEELNIPVEQEKISATANTEIKE